MCMEMCMEIHIVFMSGRVHLSNPCVYHVDCSHAHACAHLLNSLKWTEAKAEAKA